MALLILDGAGPGVRASLPGLGSREAGRAGELAAATGALLADHALAAAELEAVVGMVGPGSFTGLRAALALAHGLAAGCGRPLVGVAAAEAFALAFPGRDLMAAFAGGRAGRYVLQQISPEGKVAPPIARDGDALPGLPPACIIVGPAASGLGALLSDGGSAVAVSDLVRPPDHCIETIARARLAGRMPPRAALPLYADDLFDRTPCTR